MQFLVSNPYFRPSLRPTLFLIASLPILLWLGTWQLQRLEWKLGLVEQMEARLDAPAIAIEDASPAVDDEFRRYRVSGEFDTGVEFHWLATSEAYGIGYLVFSPLTLKDGRKVIVNRGFIPSPLKDAMADRPGGGETFEAIARVPETPGSLDATNDEAANIWFTRDTASMAKLAGGGDYLPIYLEKLGEVAEADWPKPGAAKVTLVNNHLDYALTWYGLGVVLLVIYLVFHRSQGRVGCPRE
ncbi:MAG: cytochrome c oxidase assembly protein [Parvibaculum sp.]|nr:cytochrome c oxidase assembly protein [Parvibaculum sp.]